MLNHADLKWLAANTTALNGLLQQVSHSADQARKNNGNGQNLDLIEEQVGRASRLSQSIFDRVTARILASAVSDENGAASAAPKTVEKGVSSAQAEVSVRLPVGEMALPKTTAAVPPIRNPNGERELILLVDDDEDILTGTGDMLDFEDYRVLTAKDGFETLEIYRQMGRKIDLIILDYFLPVMDGDAVFDELKAIDPDVQVVLSSGFHEHARLGSMLARGLRGFIPKPYTHEKLMEQLRLILDA
ncbi:MAG TPA: response regulator [Chthoniobacterales bacterium]|jgi:CheY-like chemotaxis protein|nr:response regulator [Chthoniobacterales bacterium]